MFFRKLAACAHKHDGDRLAFSLESAVEVARRLAAYPGVWEIIDRLGMEGSFSEADANLIENAIFDLLTSISEGEMIDFPNWMLIVAMVRRVIVLEEDDIDLLAFAQEFHYGPTSRTRLRLNEIVKVIRTLRDRPDIIAEHVEELNAEGKENLGSFTLDCFARAEFFKYGWVSLIPKMVIMTSINLTYQELFDIDHRSDDTIANADDRQLMLSITSSPLIRFDMLESEIDLAKEAAK